MKNSFDRIVTSTPVNRTAAVVARGKGDHYDPKIRDDQIHSDLPIPVKPCPNTPECIDLTGTRVGRLTVIGYYGSTGKQKRGRWVVRCVCGSYELRAAKAIKTLGVTPELACCRRCDKVAQIRTKEYQQRLPRKIG